MRTRPQQPGFGGNGGRAKTGRCHWLLVAVIMVAIANRVASELPTGKLITNGSYLIKGKPLKASCMLDGDLDISKVTASNITFRLRDVDLPERYVRVVNKTYAVLFHPDTRSFRNGQLHCRIGDKNIYSIYVYFGYEPRKPENISVLVNNWTELVIKWEKKKNKVYATTSRAYWRHSSSNITEFHKCPKEDDSQGLFQCQTVLAPNISNGYFNVKVEATNEVGKTMSDEKIAYFKDIVVPGAVRNLRVSEVASHSLRVSWEAPSTAGPLRYLITHNCSRNHSIIKESGGQEAAYTRQLEHLHPYTMCQIGIRAMSAESHLLGPFFNVSARTDSAVPSRHPEMAQSGFELTSLDKSERKVVLYWKRLPEEYQNGPLTNYIIYGHGAPVFVDPSAYYHTFYLDINATYQFYVKASNENGENKTVTEKIRIPPDLDVLVGAHNVTAIMSRNLSSALVAWSPPSDHNLSYSVFWCKGQHRRLCGDEIEWKTNIRQPPWTLELPPGEAVRNYHVGVSVEEGHTSSGIKWSDCIYQQSAESMPPSVFLGSLSVHRVELVLTRPINCDDRPGFIYAYLIQYCLGQTKDCFDSSAKSVSVAVTEEKVKYSVSGLQEGSPYQLRVYSLSKHVTPQKSNSISFTTARFFGGVHTWGWIVISVVVGVMCLLCCGIGIISTIRCNRRLARKLLQGTQKVVPPQQDLSAQQAHYESPSENSDYDTESLQVPQDVQTRHSLGEDCLLLFDSPVKMSHNEADSEVHHLMLEQDGPEVRHQAPAVYTTPAVPLDKLPTVLGPRGPGCGASGESDGSYTTSDLLRHKRAAGSGDTPLLKQSPVYNVPPTDPQQCPDQQNLENLKKRVPLQELKIVVKPSPNKGQVMGSPAWLSDITPKKLVNNDSDSDSSCAYSSAIQIMPQHLGNSLQSVGKHNQPGHSCGDSDNEKYSDDDDGNNADSSGSPDIYTPAFLCQNAGRHDTPDHICGTNRRNSGDGASESSSGGYSSSFLLHPPILTLNTPPRRQVHSAGQGVHSHGAEKRPPSELKLRTVNGDSSGGESDDCGYSTTEFRAL